jgi:DNA polymerase-3 subunit gamma/tau
MAYTVLARRYRSASFDQVVGQEPIARTLQNAIANGRVAHAYLFTGTRGVGKTSMARLFARALNAPDTIAGCPKPPETRKGDFPDAQVQQRMAEAIMRGEDLNVIEIDGASNNSVDQARQLIAGASLSPTANARYKIYIIDEVHMLSTAAFNALLKTMEEPPEHVKFILCTTEVQKVPVTIQSRCQRFDFRNIPTAQIAAHLEKVLASEKVKAEDAVVWQVARLGNGSMRDALSLLDRLLATGEPTLTSALLAQMLGLPPQERVTALVGSLGDGDAAGALRHTAELLDGGVSQDQLVEVLIEYLRQLLVISSCGQDSDLVELSDEAKSLAAAQAARFDTPGLAHMLALCDNLQRNGKLSAHPRAMLDATLVRLALAEKMADVTALLGSGRPVVAQASSPRPPVTNAGWKPAPQAPPPAPITAPPAPAVGQKKKSLDPDQTGPPPVAAPQPPTTDDGTAAIDPAALWAQVLVQVEAKASLAWARNITLRKLDGHHAVVAPLAGHRDLAKFLTPQRCEAIGTMLAQVLRHPVKVEVEAVGSREMGNGRAAGERAVTAPPASERSAVAAGVAPGSAADGAINRPVAMDRQQVLGLPMVRQVLEVFEASIIDNYPEGQERAAVPRTPPVAPLRSVGPDPTDVPVPDEPEE